MAGRVKPYPPPLTVGEGSGATAPHPDNGGGGVGLSTCHISPLPVLKVALGGNLAQLSGAGLGSPAVGGGVRGCITGFSKRSRSRLMQTVASLDRRGLEVPLFVTLTYPAQFPTDYTIYKRHLDTFLKRLRRFAPDCWAIWRLEFQRRGAPHFHLLVFGVRFLPHQVVSKMWYEVVKSGDLKHLQAGVEIRRARSWGGVTSYVAKYMGKTSDVVPTGFTGRFWGIFRRDLMPVEILEILLEIPQFHRLRRVMRQWLKSRGFAKRSGSRYQGISAFVGWLSALRLVELLD